MLLLDEDTRTEFYGGSAIDYTKYVRVDSSGSSWILDRGYPRAGFVYQLHDVKVDLRYGIPWNQAGDLLLGIHNGDLENETCELWSRDSTNLPTFPKAIVMASTPIYFHWLIEQLPSVLRSLSHAPDSQILISDDAPGWIIETCQQLGLPIEPQPRGAVHADSYTVSTRQLQAPLPEDLELLRTRVGLQGASASGKRILVSRRFSTRYSLVEEKLEKALSKLNFDIIYPEQFSIQEQIAAFSSASVVVGATGSALSNTVWMQEDSKLIVLAGSVKMNYLLWNRLNHRPSYWQIDVPSLGTVGAVDAVFRAIDT